MFLSNTKNPTLLPSPCCCTFLMQAELLAAKEKFATLNGGVPYDPPKPTKKAKGPAQTPAPQRAPGEKSKKVRRSSVVYIETKTRVVGGGKLLQC